MKTADYLRFEDWMTEQQLNGVSIEELEERLSTDAMGLAQEIGVPVETFSTEPTHWQFARAVAQTTRRAGKEFLKQLQSR